MIYVSLIDLQLKGGGGEIRGVRKKKGEKGVNGTAGGPHFSRRVTIVYYIQTGRSQAQCVMISS